MVDWCFFFSEGIMKSTTHTATGEVSSGYVGLFF